MLPVRTIAVINQKGGVGKTTTVANLGAALAARGHDLCLIDLDPQAHLTLHFGLDPDALETSAYDILTASGTIAAARRTVAPNLQLVPSDIDLAAAEVELASAVGREQILRDRLAESPAASDFVFIDCPPSLGLLTLNALAAADEVYIPLQPHFLALQGLGKLLETVALVRRRINSALRVGGVILCMYDSNTRLAAEVTADLRRFIESARGSPTPWAETRLFATVIRRNIKLAECPSYGKTIFAYAPRSRGAEDYAALAEEFLSRAPAPAEAAHAATAAAPAAGAQPADEPAPAPEDEAPAPQPPQPPPPAGRAEDDGAPPPDDSPQRPTEIAQALPPPDGPAQT
jgi:chromosome partitioning protein